MGFMCLANDLCLVSYNNGVNQSINFCIPPSEVIIFTGRVKKYFKMDLLNSNDA